MDWWALGVMAYLFIYEEFPFDGDTQEEVHDKILINKPAFDAIGKPIFVKKATETTKCARNSPIWSRSFSTPTPRSALGTTAPRR